MPSPAHRNHLRFHKAILLLQRGAMERGRAILEELEAEQPPDSTDPIVVQARSALSSLYDELGLHDRATELRKLLARLEPEDDVIEPWVRQARNELAGIVAVPCPMRRLRTAYTSDGRPTFEHIPVDELPDGTVRLRGTPQFSEDIARGDVIRVDEGPDGTYTLIQRGGNVGIQVIPSGPIGDVLAEFEPRWRAAGGRIDGTHERAFTASIPVRVGFSAIERALAGVEGWAYANVYDPETEKPLGWWDEP